MSATIPAADVDLPAIVNTNDLHLLLPPDTDPVDLSWGWRLCHPDFTSSRGYRWPFPGQWAEAPGPINERHKGACPDSHGDGVCVARTWAGARSGGITSPTVLVCAWAAADVLGDEGDKVRLRRAWVAEVITVRRLVGPRANLSRANLSRANLSAANLSAANLYRANLSAANLYRVDLSRADLYGADLSGADLSGANLYGANLYGANLYGADLSGANLSGANLYGADLYGANSVSLPDGWALDSHGVAYRKTEAGR